ncbi:MAG: type I-E CRISPR-associated protein Cse2/CasB [Oscillospiraceae bacterium]|jgi:CRISPR system Cascade subunit CasB|nr:type I-E CRISPR-associated protein Cse2/CasB [Oscillospiraceae bacterium]
MSDIQASTPIYKAVFSQISRITSGSEPLRRAILAKLRRGAGKHPGSVPEIWEYTIGSLPDDIAYKSESEWAVHAALTLFAVHKQGADNTVTGTSGGTLGSAVAKLCTDKNKDAITRRFNSAVTADGIEGLTVHARSLVQMLRVGKIDMDYQKFAEELFSWQFNREKTRLEWGRDYWYIINKSANENQGDKKQ